MLFSSLVDADFLDTEQFFEPRKSAVREGYTSLKDLLPLFSRYMEKKQENAPDTSVNTLRASILRQCEARAVETPGFFTLTVPTGGGKTLSSLAFALKHAAAYHKRRIIYVIPYTSIIEQTADQFREIFGDVVVEHRQQYGGSR